MSAGSKQAADRIAHGAGAALGRVGGSTLAEMPFGDHLEELRRRLMLALFGLVPALIGALAVGQQVLELLLVPVRAALRARDLPDALIATSPFEPFMAYVTVSFILALLVASPWILYQLWKFVAPGLYANERRFVYILLPMSGVLTALSVFFLYFAMIPVILTFFVSFGSGVGEQAVRTEAVAEGVSLPTLPVLDADPVDPKPGEVWINRGLQQMRVCLAVGEQTQVLGMTLTRSLAIRQDYKVGTYLNLVLMLALGLAVAFQTPVVVLLLGWAGLIERAVLVKYRKQVVMGCVVASAVLTPADPLSLVVLAVPVYLLFELGSLLLVVLPASRVAGTGGSAGVPDGE